MTSTLPDPEVSDDCPDHFPDDSVVSLEEKNSRSFKSDRL
jgi:hypothetical protein